jgi:hypothetical protein
MAIMVQTSRTKDKARLEEIIKAELSYDRNQFQMILNQFDLIQKWEKMQSGFEL